MTEPADQTTPAPRRRRRAVGPPGARPPGEEPRPEPRPEDAERERDDDARLLADVPPHHGPV